MIVPAWATALNSTINITHLVGTCLSYLLFKGTVPVFLLVQMFTVSIIHVESIGDTCACVMKMCTLMNKLMKPTDRISSK